MDVLEGEPLILDTGQLLQRVRCQLSARSYWKVISQRHQNPHRSTHDFFSKSDTACWSYIRQHVCKYNQDGSLCVSLKIAFSYGFGVKRNPRWGPQALVFSSSQTFLGALLRAARSPDSTLHLVLMPRASKGLACACGFAVTFGRSGFRHVLLNVLSKMVFTTLYKRFNMFCMSHIYLQRRFHQVKGSVARLIDIWCAERVVDEGGDARASHIDTFQIYQVLSTSLQTLSFPCFWLNLLGALAMPVIAKSGCKSTILCTLSTTFYAGANRPPILRFHCFPWSVVSGSPLQFLSTQRVGGVNSWKWDQQQNQQPKQLERSFEKGRICWLPCPFVCFSHFSVHPLTWL